LQVQNILSIHFELQNNKVTGCSCEAIKRQKSIWRNYCRSTDSGKMVQQPNENVKDLAAVVNQMINVMRHHFDRLPYQ